MLGRCRVDRLTVHPEVSPEIRLLWTLWLKVFSSQGWNEIPFTAAIASKKPFEPALRAKPGAILLCRKSRILGNFAHGISPSLAQLRTRAIGPRQFFYLRGWKIGNNLVDCRFENLVARSANAANGGTYFDIYENTKPLCRRPTRIKDSEAVDSPKCDSAGIIGQSRGPVRYCKLFHC